MTDPTLAKYWGELHKRLQDARPSESLYEAMSSRKVPPGAERDLLDFVARRVTVGDVRAWMIEAGVELPGVVARAKSGKPNTSHGAKTKDAFIITMLSGRPFMPGLFATYPDALSASAIADMPTKIDRYSIPLTTAGDYCEKCVDLVVKASLNHGELPSYHED